MTRGSLVVGGGGLCGGDGSSGVASACPQSGHQSGQYRLPGCCTTEDRKQIGLAERTSVSQVLEKQVLKQFIIS